MKRAQGPIAEELPAVLAEQGRSLRWLASELGIDVAYISRAVRRAGGKVPSEKLIADITRALDLPSDYFAETREERVVAAVRRDPKLRERIYRGLRP